MRLSKKSQKYCGITPYYGSDSYLYQRLGMGHSVSPAIWQNFIQKVLQEIPDYRKSHLSKQKGKYHLIAYYSKKLPEAVERYSISELKLTGVMANVVTFKHLLRNANFHVYCDHSALVHILKAKENCQH